VDSGCKGPLLPLLIPLFMLPPQNEGLTALAKVKKGLLSYYFGYNTALGYLTAHTFLVHSHNSLVLVSISIIPFHRWEQQGSMSQFQIRSGALVFPVVLLRT